MKTIVLTGAEVRSGKANKNLNGLEVKTEIVPAPKFETTETTKELATEEPAKHEPAAVTTTAPALPMVANVRPADRFARAEQFARLKGKYDFLKKRSDELEAFKMSDDGSNSTITINSANGDKITLNNADVIQEVVKLCGNVLGKLLSDAENEVLTFEI